MYSVCVCMCVYVLYVHVCVCVCVYCMCMCVCFLLLHMEWIKAAAQASWLHISIFQLSFICKGLNVTEQQNSRTAGLQPTAPHYTTPILFFDNIYNLAKTPEYFRLVFMQLFVRHRRYRNTLQFLTPIEPLLDLYQMVGGGWGWGYLLWQGLWRHAQFTHLSLHGQWVY